MKHNAFFITFEGCEAVGKSTQAKILYNRLKDIGCHVLLTREPGGSPGAEKLRNLILRQDFELSSRAEVMAHMTARCDHIDQIIKPALKNGAIVICDRFHDSTWAYQGYGIAHKDEKILDFIKKIQNIISFSPDLTFLLETSDPIRLMRLNNRNQEKDRYESLENNFHERVREGFEYLYKEDLKKDKKERRFEKINASETCLSVSEKIYNTCLEKIFNKIK